MDLLLSEAGLRRLGDRLAAVAPDVRTLRLQTDKRVLDEAGRELGDEDVQPEVAWGSADQFDDGLARRFFGLVLRAPSLRWIQSAAAGLDAPVFAMILERGIRLTSSHVNSIPIAEWVVASVLDHYQDPHGWRVAQTEGTWQPRRFREVHGTTWVVIGMGGIGVAVATRARAFGATVVGVRRTPRGDEPVDRMVALADLAAVLPDAHVVVLATPATAEARGLVGDAFLAALRPDSVLVNVGRGSLVDEEALLRSLDRGQPDRAILDVFATEPLPPDSPLWTHPRVWVSPHTSAGGLGSLERGAELFLENLGRYRREEPLLHEVGPDDVGEQQEGGR